jgi:hypothetical protein
LLTDPRVTNREQINYLNTTAYWQAANGLLNQKLTADADQDGYENLLEAAFGLDPLVPGPAGVPVQTIVPADGQSYPAITFTRDPAILDITMMVEWSSDLLDWSTSMTTEIFRVLSDGVETIMVRSNFPAGSGAQFLRVKVDAP